MGVCVCVWGGGEVVLTRYNYGGGWNRHVYILHVWPLCPLVLLSSCSINLWCPPSGPLAAVALPISLACANITNGHYHYTEDLLKLAAATPLFPVLHGQLCTVRVECLRPYLESHPDSAFAMYIYEGLRNGFRVGFDYHQCPLRGHGVNHPSSLVNEGVVDGRLSSEVEAARLFGPVLPHLKSLVHINPMGLVPKPHVNKFRLIVDLSHPRGFSVNDGIPPSLWSLRYSSVDDAVEIIRHLAGYQRCISHYTSPPR